MLTNAQKQIIEAIEKEFDALNQNLQFDDVDGNQLSIGDKVVMLDVTDLDGDDLPPRGSILVVDGLHDVESNYMGFSGYSFFGNRVLKLW
jgi:hypothetical protein